MVANGFFFHGFFLRFLSFCNYSRRHFASDVHGHKCWVAQRKESFSIEFAGNWRINIEIELIGMRFIIMKLTDRPTNPAKSFPHLLRWIYAIWPFRAIYSSVFIALYIGANDILVGFEFYHSALLKLMRPSIRNVYISSGDKHWRWDWVAACATPFPPNEFVIESFMSVDIDIYIYILIV